MHRPAILLAACLAVAACATSPLETSGVSSRVTPRQALEDMPALEGERVQWGGEIVSISNHEQSTIIEVLSYPLARDGLPNSYEKPTGRFVLRRGAFLEPQDYAPGRMLTVVGTIRGVTRRSVGDTELVVPLVSAEQLQLWDDQYGSRSRPRFGFGVGISVGF